jgi:uncharacterized membrane protein YqhA
MQVTMAAALLISMVVVVDGCRHAGTWVCAAHHPTLVAVTLGTMEMTVPAALLVMIVFSMDTGFWHARS